MLVYINYNMVVYIGPMHMKTEEKVEGADCASQETQVVFTERIKRVF